MHPEIERGNYGENCAYYDRFFTVYTTAIADHNKGAIRFFFVKKQYLFVFE